MFAGKSIFLYLIPMVPSYPEFAPIDLSLRAELHPHFQRLESGISEFTFSNIYLFRRTYGYRLSRLEEGVYVISGSRHGKTFFALPWGPPQDKALLDDLMAHHDYWKNCSLPQKEGLAELLASQKWEARPDRDNWDYVYDCQEMADLDGKKFHKKRNHINAFFSTYPEGFTFRDMTDSPEDTQDALQVLETWQTGREDQSDYLPSKEGIELRKELELSGRIWFLGGKPIAYAQGEAMRQGRCFVIHFEKADGSIKGVYQTIFQDWSKTLCQTYQCVNREQDLGDPGLRQAKETYRPVEFIEKYQVWPVTQM